MKADDLTVQSLLLRRKHEGSAPEARKDPFHLALVIEGGGMRGVVSGGMVSGLEEAGLLRCFDSIHGSSAGACAGAYFAAGQAELGTSIYYENINNKKFINLLGPLLGRPIMDASFLIDHVMRVIKPLNVEQLLNRPSYLNVVVTDVLTADATTFDCFRSPDEFFLKLKASIFLPLIAGKAVLVDGRPMCDGGFVQQIALTSAVSLGATHVLGLMTRKEDELVRPAGRKAPSLEERAIRLAYGYRMASAYSRRNSLVNDVIAKLRAGSFIDPRGNVIKTDYVARPTGSIRLDRLTAHGAILKTAAEEAREAIRVFLRRIVTQPAQPQLNPHVPTSG